MSMNCIIYIACTVAHAVVVYTVMLFLVKETFNTITYLVWTLKAAETSELI